MINVSLCPKQTPSFTLHSFTSLLNNFYYDENTISRMIFKSSVSPPFQICHWFCVCQSQPERATGSPVELHILTPIFMEYSNVLLAVCVSPCDRHTVSRGGQVADMKLGVVDTVKKLDKSQVKSSDKFTCHPYP